MVFPVFPNHMTTAMTSLQLASFWILPQVNNVAAYRINFILDQTQWAACLFISIHASVHFIIIVLQCTIYHEYWAMIFMHYR